MAKQPHPLTRYLIEEFREQHKLDRTLTKARFLEKAGLSASAFDKWRSGCDPSVRNLDRAFRVLGYRLAVMPLPDA